MGKMTCLEYAAMKGYAALLSELMSRSLCYETLRQYFALDGKDSSFNLFPYIKNFRFSILINRCSAVFEIIEEQVVNNFRKDTTIGVDSIGAAGKIPRLKILNGIKCSLIHNYQFITVCIMGALQHGAGWVAHPKF